MIPEKRHHVRVTLELPAFIETADGRFNAATRDLSFGGIYITCREEPTELYMGAELMLGLVLQEEPQLVARILARAVRFDQDGTHLGIGLRLVSADLESYEHFKNVIIANSPDPDRVQRELEENPGLLILSKACNKPR